jgi:HEAT repeat protein
LIKELDFKKDIDELIYQFKNDSDVLGRRWAMNELLAIDGPDASRARAAVVVGLRSEKFAGLRREGLDSISAPSGGSFKPEQQIVDALKTFSSDADPGVRSLAMSRLGLLNDVANAPLFISNLSAESYRVVDAAAAGLARLKDSKYYPMLEKLARTDGWKDNVRVSGLKALALLGDRRAMPLGIEYSNPKFSTAVRNAAAQILASSGKGDNSSFQILMQNFKEAIEEGNQWNVFRSLRNLATFGDVRAEGAFKTAKDKFKSDAQFLEALTRVEADFVKALKK